MINNPIFLVGCHKSGTSLLRNLFDGHPDLFVVPFEAHIFQHNGYWIDYGIRNQMPYDINKKEIVENYSKFLEHLNNVKDRYSDNTTNGVWDIGKFRSDLVSKDGYEDIKVSVENYINAVYSNLYNQDIPDNIRVVEKSVDNLEFVIELKKLFPNAKFIHILRNPYSNIVSIRKYKSKKGYPFLKKITKSLYKNWYCLEINKRLLGEDYYIVQYEELVKNHKEIMSRIASFLNISFCEEILYPTELGRNWTGNSIYDIKYQGVSDKNINYWENEINCLEINIINKMLGNIPQRYGYDKIQTKKKWYFPNKGEGIREYILNRLLYGYFL